MQKWPMHVQCYGRHYEAKDGQELTALLELLANNRLALANQYRVSVSPLSRWPMATPADVPAAAPDSARQLIADMREAAKQWREAYPGRTYKGVFARGNFANWIDHFANRLNDLSMELQPEVGAVDPQVTDHVKPTTREKSSDHSPITASKERR